MSRSKTRKGVAAEEEKHPSKNVKEAAGKGSHLKKGDAAAN